MTITYVKQNPIRRKDNSNFEITNRLRITLVGSKRADAARLRDGRY